MSMIAISVGVNRERRLRPWYCVIGRLDAASAGDGSGCDGATKRTGIGPDCISGGIAPVAGCDSKPTGGGEVAAGRCGSKAIGGGDVAAGRGSGSNGADGVVRPDGHGDAWDG